MLGDRSAPDNLLLRSTIEIVSRTMVGKCGKWPPLLDVPDVISYHTLRCAAHTHRVLSREVMLPGDIRYATPTNATNHWPEST